MFAIIDTETTGGNPSKDKVMEIAIIIYDGEKVIEEYSTLVNPLEPIAPFIRSLTGIDESMVKDAPTFEEIADKVLEMTEGKIFVAHNVRFDYGILRNEFQRLGIKFLRKQLCTVKLSRELIPGHNSYSLGRLCKDLEINLEGRHRAYGDALATAELFGRLYVNDKDRIRAFTEDDVKDSVVPPLIKKEILEDLPEEAGVFYFLDKENTPLYIGKGKNIRKSLIRLLSKDFASDAYNPLIENICDISYEVTGSELVAMLLAQEELLIKRPPYNFTVRKTQYKYGLFSSVDEQGFLRLKIDSLAENNRVPYLEFSSKRSANNTLKKLMETHQLCPLLCGYENEYPDRKLPKALDAYNFKLKKILSRYLFKNDNFFLIGEGRSHHEHSIVWVDKQKYMGFGFFEPEYIENDIESLKESIKPRPVSP
ncbi:MAG: exonuclease domain-containing protein, partial [Chitinophagales bacterium]